MNREPHCPKCKETCIKRTIKKSIVYDCQGCGDTISSEAIEFWLMK